MKKGIKDVIDARCNRLLELQVSVEERLKNLPEGKLRIRHYGDGVYYTQMDSSGKERSLHDIELIQNLVQREYLEKVIAYTKAELDLLLKVQKRYPSSLIEDVYDRLSDERKAFAKPIIPTDEQFIKRWEEKPFTPKEFGDGTPYFQTMRGERVRSKSEMIIADRLFANGIPYKYECPLTVGNAVIHPDFTILKKSDRKEVYLEHCGRVGDQEYADDMVGRINEYTMAGIKMGDRLFLTFESANKPLDVRVIDKMITDYFK